MDKKILEDLKNKLQRHKATIEGELLGFAKKDKEIKGDWNTHFPSVGGSSLEEEADEVEQYEAMLPIEHTLENRLKEIDIALEKIETGKYGAYGMCEKCQKEIAEERLDAIPETKFCNQCKAR
jgi:RNA polymerase-binding transcription factor DksA